MEKIGAMLPKGAPSPFEVNAAQSRKELTWSRLNELDRSAFRKAAKEHWQVWLDSDAVEVLSPEKSKWIRQELRRRGEEEKILEPRFVLTDKSDGLRTDHFMLPVNHSARLVVPGFKDWANLMG